LAALGVKPPAHLPYKGEAEGTSILTIFDPRSGQSQTTLLPIPEAHGLVALPGGGFAVLGNHRHALILDAALQPRLPLIAPDDREFGGHGVLVGGHLLVSLRTSRKQDEAHPGELLLLDLATGKVLDRRSSGGYEPHDMTTLRDGRIVVANYGNRRRSDLASYAALEPTLAFLSPRDLSLADVVKGPQLGALSHLSEGPDGRLALLPATLMALAPSAVKTVTQALGGVLPDLSAPEIIEQKIGAPSPVLTLDVATGTWRSFLVDPARQRRPQSLAYHPGVKAWFVTYPFSEQVARLGDDGEVTFCAGFAAGIPYVRGVAVLPGDDGLYVSGQFRGLARLDARDLAVTARFDVPLHDCTHLHALPT